MQLINQCMKPDNPVSGFTTVCRSIEAPFGTMFLDEIGELGMNPQKKLLRFLQEREITRIGGIARIKNVRIVAATHHDLEQEVLVKKFR